MDWGAQWGIQRIGGLNVLWDRKDSDREVRIKKWKGLKNSPHRRSITVQKHVWWNILSATAELVRTVKPAYLVLASVMQEPNSFIFLMAGVECGQAFPVSQLVKQQHTLPIILQINREEGQETGQKHPHALYSLLIFLEGRQVWEKGCLVVYRNTWMLCAGSTIVLCPFLRLVKC